MNKCLKIMLLMQKIPKDFLNNGVKESAQSFSIEGTVQIMDATTIKIIACGEKEDIDSFLDALHREVAQLSLDDMQIEPFLKEKDYRGVFRIIE